MQSKRYSWHPCVHCHGYLVHLQQNGLVHDLTLQLQEHSLVHHFSTSPAAAVFSENLNAINSGVPNTNSPKVFSAFFSLYSISKRVFWQAQSSKNSKQFFQQAIINSTPADSTCCILFEGAVLTWQFEHGNLASKACLREHSCPHNHLSLSGKNKGLRHNNKDQEVLNKGLSWMGGTNSSLPEKQFGLLWCHKFYSTNWINCDLLRY